MIAQVYSNHKRLVERSDVRYTSSMATQSTKKRTVAKSSAKKAGKVDFEPNKMALAVAALSAVTLVLLALIVSL